jgi:hypothetical protein
VTVIFSGGVSTPEWLESGVLESILGSFVALDVCDDEKRHKEISLILEVETFHAGKRCLIPC